jgi:hypothetical protein
MGVSVLKMLTTRLSNPSTPHTSIIAYTPLQVLGVKGKKEGKAIPVTGLGGP